MLLLLPLLILPPLLLLLLLLSAVVVVIVSYRIPQSYLAALRLLRFAFVSIPFRFWLPPKYTRLKSEDCRRLKTED